MTSIIFDKNQIPIYKRTLIINLPVIGLNNPPMGPAIIQALAKQTGIETAFVDLNLDLQKDIQFHPLAPKILYEWSMGLRSQLDLQEQQWLDLWTEPYLDRLQQFDLLSVSCFSMASHNFALYFLQRCRNRYKGKIVIGGAGVGTSYDTYQYFGKKLLDLGLVDYFVIGEGEQSWLAVVKNNLPWPGVNGVPHVNLASFDPVPLPDYSGYDLDAYFNSQARGRTIGVEGSRGCVRNCTFCDIRSFWKTYKFKDGTKLANELIALKKMHEVKHFFFNDSLVNGSDKAFRDFIQTLAAYNKTGNDHIKWSGYYIIKHSSVYKEQDWSNLRDSGVQSLFIGIESGSESVRDHMRKKFSNDDLEHTMIKLQRYGIQCTWLFIIGYPTETRKDFEMTLDLLRKFQPMALDRTIDTVALGMTLGILDDTPLANMVNDLNIRSVVQDHHSGVYWESDANNFRQRVSWRIEAEKLIRELGYNSWVGENDVVSWFEARLDDIEQGKISMVDISEHHG